MKTNCWLLMGLMVATSAVGQSNTNSTVAATPSPIVIVPAASAPPAPNVVTAAPAGTAPIKKKKPAVKHKKPAAEAVKKIALVEPTVTLVPGPAEVAADNVNVRVQAGLKGEFITHLSKGDAVVVLGQINLDKHQVDEPAQWAKISFPTNAHVWVNSTFIDATNKTVLVKKLNLRAGPGENYSVLGVVERGTPLNAITARGAWTEIEPPATAYAFIAAIYVKQEASGTLAVNPPPSSETVPPEPAPAPTPTPVPDAQAIVTTPTNPPVQVVEAPTNAPVVAAVTDTNIPAIADTNVTAEVSTNPPPPRIVTHQGVVRHVTSIIEPTAYEIYDPKTKDDIDYLYTTSTNVNFSIYKGLTIVVTGEEDLSYRWGHTPVLTVTEIHVLK